MLSGKEDVKRKSDEVAFHEIFTILQRSLSGPRAEAGPTHSASLAIASQTPLEIDVTMVRTDYDLIVR